MRSRGEVKKRFMVRFPPPLRGRIKEGGIRGYYLRYFGNLTFRPPIPTFPRKGGRSQKEESYEIHDAAHTHGAGFTGRA